MLEQPLYRAADVFFTVCMLLMAGFGIALVWAMGNLHELLVAMLAVSFLAPVAYRRTAKAR